MIRAPILVAKAVCTVAADCEEAIGKPAGTLPADAVKALADGVGYSACHILASDFRQFTDQTAGFVILDVEASRRAHGSRCKPPDSSLLWRPAQNSGGASALPNDSLFHDIYHSVDRR
jgi:hypothetical protein